MHVILYVGEFQRKTHIEIGDLKSLGKNIEFPLKKFHLVETSFSSIFYLKFSERMFFQTEKIKIIWWKTGNL